MPKINITAVPIAILIVLSLLSLTLYPPHASLISRVLSLHDQDTSFTLIIGGDVMLGRSVNSRLSRTRDYSWPFRYIGDYMRSADLTYVNLESPLTSACQLTDSGMRLCGDPSNVASLISAGVDVASLANNHALDYGSAGLTETQQVLTLNNIETSGMGKVVIKDIKGLRVAFVSFNDVGNLSGIDSATDTTLKARLSEADRLADFVIATFHWGREYESNPTSRQISLAHQAVSLGADLVVGAHPHWIQTKEVYQGVPIYYSLGNTIFDQEWSEATRTGLVIKVYIQDSVINKIDELVLYSSNYGQPRWLNK